jgi:hypothetical protein
MVKKLLSFLILSLAIKNAAFAAHAASQDALDALQAKLNK